MRALFVMNLLAALVLSSGHATASPPNDISAKELRRMHTQVAKGHAWAQYNLGDIYESGKGVPQDYATARQWYEKAAVQGNATAQINLGKLYLDGQGVPQNDVRAYMWFNLAAGNSKGDLRKMSADNRDEVAHRMTYA